LLKKSLDVCPAPTLKRNVPINGSIEVSNINGLKIYKYPEVKFTDEDDLRAISLMVVGQTGSGKTTLLNSFVNYLLGIQLEDDFRYKIIFEENDVEQSKSVTQNVNIYNIAAHGRFPPIKIIDTPAYGDTRGIKRDHEITELIK
jgi:septin family protein